MTGRTAILKKEFTEIWRTYKIYVIPSIFIFFGLLSPLLAKFTPEILKSFVQDQGIQINIPPPKAMDAYLQWVKNLNQLAVLVVIFSLIGLVADEKNRGSAAIILTKPVSRRSFILAKYTANAVLMLVSMALSYLACMYYTVILFDQSMFAASVETMVLVAVYFLLIMAVTLFTSTVARSLSLSGAFAVGGFLCLSVLPSFHPWLARYSPGALTGYQNKILQGAASMGDAVPALFVCLGLTLLLIVSTVAVFQRQEL